MFAPQSLGEVVAPASVRPEAFGLVLPAGRCPLVLAPSSARGWFGGHAMVAWSPAEVDRYESLAEAAPPLERAYSAQVPELTCVLSAYDAGCVAATYRGALVLTGTGWRVWGEQPSDVLDVCREAAQRWDSRRDDAELAGALQGAPVPPGVASRDDGPLLISSMWDMSGREYRAAVEQTRERIAAGDVYVLNLTTRLSGDLAVTPPEAFAEIVRRAPADFAAYFAPGGCARPTPSEPATGKTTDTAWIASVSPERFVRIEPGEDDARLVEVCPIKGTRPRGSSKAADAELAAALLADEKERAEHVMVVDLERNDLGVSCTPGTIHVDPLYEVVPTPYCHQLVSSVRGTLRWDATFAEALGGLFPCGSVTGAPKVAAVHIASELEHTRRGAYCGSLLVAVPGALDSSVLIRTLESSDSRPDRAQWGAGCGITYDSDPAAEFLELLLKTSPVLGDLPPQVALRETMRAAFGRVPLLDRHLARLALAGTGPSALARVRTAVAERLVELDSRLAYARIGVTVTPDGDVAAGVTCEPSSLSVAGGPRMAVFEMAELPDLPPAAAKPASRRYWDKAHRAAQREGADQAILVDANGRLIDGSTANLWLVLGGRLATPQVPHAVAGVAREVVFDIAARFGIGAEERALTVADMHAADEVWLSNAVGGFVPARGRGGQIGSRIAEEFERLFSR